ncbi:hypothetical protein LCGC14_2838020, partial [marine sediment metagenome]
MNEHTAAPEAEAAVLGSMILEPDCIDKVLGIMPHDAFYYPENRLLLEAILEARDKHPLKDGKIDIVVIRDSLKRANQLGNVGGVDYIVQVVESVPGAANAEYYATIVKEKALCRELNTAGGKILSMIEERGDV